MPTTTYAKHAMLNALPSPVYAAFFTGGAPGVGTEVAAGTLWGSGNRPAVALSAASGGARTPDGDAPLGVVAVASQVVSHIAYYDAATSGNMLGYGAYSRTFLQNDEVEIPDAAEVFRLTDPA